MIYTLNYYHFQILCRSIVAIIPVLLFFVRSQSNPTYETPLDSVSVNISEAYFSQSDKLSTIMISSSLSALNDYDSSQSQF